MKLRGLEKILAISIGLATILPLSKADAVTLKPKEEKIEEKLQEREIRIGEYIEIPKEFYEKTKDGIKFRNNLKFLDGKINNKNYVSKNFSNLIIPNNNIPDIAVFSVINSICIMVDNDFIKKYSKLYAIWNFTHREGMSPMSSLYKITLLDGNIYFNKGKKIEYNKTNLEGIYVDIIKVKNQKNESDLPDTDMVIYSGKELVIPFYEKKIGPPAIFMKCENCGHKFLWGKEMGFLTQCLKCGHPDIGAAN